MKGAIFLNGNPPSQKIMSEVCPAGILTIAADGAYNYVKDYFTPDIVLGDFDSIGNESPSFPASCEVLRFRSEKDYTDGFLAVKESIYRGAKDLEIYGAAGGRVDHEYVNYELLAYASSRGARGVIRGEKFDVYFLDAKKNKLINISVNPGNIVSLVAFSDNAHILYTKGLKYRCDSLRLDKVHKIGAMGISNKAQDPSAEIRIKKGQVLVFAEKT